jgi:hypothetical protein
MENVRLRSPCEKVDGLVYFGRMVDQIRTHAKGELPPEYQASLGEGLDEHCVNFLAVSYNLVVQYVNEGLSIERFCNRVLAWDIARLKLKFTCGTNSCLNEAGMMTLPRR